LLLEGAAAVAGRHQNLRLQGYETKMAFPDLATPTTTA